MNVYMQNFEIMTIQELKDKYNNLSEQFEMARQTMIESHNIMLNASKEANQIKDIIEKRGGQL